MTIPTTGPISFAHIRGELNLVGVVSFSDSSVRTLADVLSGPISLADFRGKSGSPSAAVSPEAFLGTRLRSLDLPPTFTNLPVIELPEFTASLFTRDGSGNRKPASQLFYDHLNLHRISGMTAIPNTAEIFGSWSSNLPVWTYTYNNPAYFTEDFVLLVAGVRTDIHPDAGDAISGLQAVADGAAAEFCYEHYNYPASPDDEVVVRTVAGIREIICRFTAPSHVLDTQTNHVFRHRVAGGAVQVTPTDLFGVAVGFASGDVHTIPPQDWADYGGQYKTSKQVFADYLNLGKQSVSGGATAATILMPSVQEGGVNHAEPGYVSNSLCVLTGAQSFADPSFTSSFFSGDDIKLQYTRMSWDPVSTVTDPQTIEGIAEEFYYEAVRKEFNIPADAVFPDRVEIVGTLVQEVRVFFSRSDEGSHILLNPELEFRYPLP